jgi:SAM-dependent methyltransferase
MWQSPTLHFRAIVMAKSLGFVRGGSMEDLKRQIDAHFYSINEPFNLDRNPSRMIVDFGFMLSCMNRNLTNRNALDMGSGTAWLSEWLNRLGLKTYSVDIAIDMGHMLSIRSKTDVRLTPSNMTYICADCHELPFRDAFMAYSFCFDSLHHMVDYSRVFKELYRILIPGGRAIFAEPGARHSKSEQTIDFLKLKQKEDPTWIEKDVVLEEIYEISMMCGFSSFRIKPFLLPDIYSYSYHEWQQFRLHQSDYYKIHFLDLLEYLNYNDHLVFYVEK